MERPGYLLSLLPGLLVGVILLAGCRGERDVTAVSQPSDVAKCLGCPTRQVCLVGRFRVRDAGDLPVEVAVADEGMYVATKDRGGTVRVWEVASAKESCVFGADLHVYTAAFAPTGSLLILPQGGRLQFWDPATATMQRQFPETAIRGGGIPVFSADGRFLASWDDDTVVVWNTETEKETCTISAPGHGLICAVFSSDGRQLASGGGDSTIRIWDLEHGTELVRLQLYREEAASRLAFSPSGTRLVAGCGGKLLNHYTLRLWHVASRAQVMDRAAFWGSPIAFAPDGHVLQMAEKGLMVLDSTPNADSKAAVLVGATGYYPAALSPHATACAFVFPGNVVEVWRLTWSGQKDSWTD